MIWEVPKYNRTQVNKAGQILAAPGVSSADHEEARIIVNNWRKSHSYPLNTYQITLRKRARKIDKTCLVAQRIKRLPSIVAKLQNEITMKLANMQDIGGCRAIMHSVQMVKTLTENYESGYLGHEYVKTYNYIDNPKTDGYRGMHVVYKYHSRDHQEYHRLRIEIQIRTKLQHAWAVAVEAVGAYTKESIKARRGNIDWAKFFQLMAAWIAINERSAPVKGVSNDPSALKEEIRQYEARLNALNYLRAYRTATRELVNRKKHDERFFLLQLDFSTRHLKIERFGRREQGRASDRYLAVERAVEGNPQIDVVLVSVDSIKALPRAYPNYYMNTSGFEDELVKALK